MAAITSIYLVSSLPTFQFFRFCDKRSVAIYFLGFRHQRMDYRFYFDSNVVSMVLPVIIGYAIAIAK
jgi:hypothetical protein